MSMIASQNDMAHRTMRVELAPHDLFQLATVSRYFGDWATLGPSSLDIVLPFPVEGWQTSAAVVLRQEGERTIVGEIYGTGENTDNTDKAWQQALATLSLDGDASNWTELGQRDPVIGHLQNAYSFLRPVLFYSPYEAAANFIIGHRISMKQTRAIRQDMAEQIGEHIAVGETIFHAFPRPQVLHELSSFKGVNAEKIQRLHSIAHAALDGLLDRTYLRSLPVEQALEKLCSLPGIGAFFSQGILLRGAGLWDEVTDDDVTKEAVQLAYKLPQRPNQKTVLEIAETWRPYRMWANVLLHVWLRREMGGPHRR
ncbi:MAG TPA: Fe-S cluster assembly protein HesB [Ktedonobacter sp.]|nr:Fe-S cluster assembly protein HesB [Ktedonobacter sp.]